MDSVDRDPSAVPEHFNLNDKRSETITDHLQSHENIDTVTQDYNIMERGISGGNCTPFLQVQIKEEYSMDSVDRDPLAVPEHVNFNEERSVSITNRLQSCENIEAVRQDHNIMEREISEGDCTPFLQIEIKEEYSMDSLDRDPLAVPENLNLNAKPSETITNHSQLLENNEVITQDYNVMEREIVDGDCTPFLQIQIKEEYSVDDCLVQEQDHLAISPNFRLCSKWNTEDKHFQCATCSKKFSHKSLLNKHCRIHTGIKPFKCSTCSKTFSDKSFLKRHNRIHTGDKPFKCSICNKAFSLKSTLVTHSRLHTGDKPFTCPTCSKTFSHQSFLTRHNRIHTGDKPFKCATCNKTFGVKSTLVTHSRLHTGVKPFTCPACSKTFTLKAHLTTHIRNHTGEKPFKCEICSKTFSLKSNLITHMRRHTGDKPFKCAACSKPFSRKSALIDHCRIHTGEKPFKCATCSKSFSRKSILAKHSRMHT